MLSKRDKLLARPWQQRRYDNHRRKVQSALPAIDNSTPPTMLHISIKLKKKQQEIERISKIEKENLILLRKLSQIMKTNRVDNYWNTPPPNFLNRVNMYQIRPRKTELPQTGDDEIIGKKVNHIRKSKCSACTPKKEIPEKIPEERIPWEPEKPPVSRKRSQSVPARRLSSLAKIQERKGEETSKHSQKERSKSCKANLKVPRSLEDCVQSPRSFILKRGNLQLAINFPSDASVILRDGNSERLLFGGECYCASMGKAY